jgi:hypothetical protein
MFELIQRWLTVFPTSNSNTYISISFFRGRSSFLQGGGQRTLIHHEEGKSSSRYRVVSDEHEQKTLNLSSP